DWNKQLQFRLYQEAKLAEVARSLGDISHEVKNLLMPIVMGTDLLDQELSKLFQKLPQNEQENLKSSQKLCDELTEMLSTASRRIQERVKEIGDCVKNLTSPADFAPCDLGSVIDNAFKILLLVAHQKKISLHTEGVDALPTIAADSRRLFNVFYNLINNAISEVPPGGSITVKGHVEPNSKVVILSVADTGKGMLPEIRDTLFTNRVISRKHGGTGLGTKIVKDVVDAHGGWIKVDSEEGKGTTVVFSLPFEPPRQSSMTDIDNGA